MNLCNKDVCLDEVRIDPVDETSMVVNLINLDTGQIIQKRMSFQSVVNKLFRSELKRLRQDGWKI